MADGQHKSKMDIGTETHYRNVGFLGIPGGGIEGAVDVKDGKI